MAKSYYDFTISKRDVNSSFTKVPNIIVEDLMYYLTQNELRLVLYILQKSNDFKYNRDRIAKKFGIHKKNMDKVFASLEMKKLLLSKQDGYELNLFICTSDLKLERLVKSMKKAKSYHEKTSKILTSSSTLSEVNNTSSETNNNSDNSIGEVRNTADTGVKYTSYKNLTNKPSIEDYREEKSSNNTNHYKTKKDISIDNDNLNRNTKEGSINSLIEKSGHENQTSSSNLIIESSSPNGRIKSEDTSIPNSIPFLFEHDEVLCERYGKYQHFPEEIKNSTDGFIALVAISYRLNHNTQWEELYQSIEFSKKYLGDYLAVCKSALAVQFFKNTPNNLAKEMLSKSRLDEEELVNLFFNLMTPYKKNK